MPAFIGIDIGTTGAKTLAIDETGASLASATAEYPLHTPHPGWAEQSPADWWRATVETLRVVLATVPAKDVAAVSFSGQMHGSVFLDRNGEVIRECLLWCDQRTAPQCEEILDRLGQDRLTEMTANTALAGFTSPKVLWLKEEEPDNYARLSTLLLPKDYVRFRLTGEVAQEMSDAAGTLMFDVRRRRWSAEFMAAMDLDDAMLPPVYESTDKAGAVTAAAAKETGLAEGTPVVAGGADNTCGATGTGVVRPGLALVSTGTSGVVFSPTAQPAPDPAQRIHCFCHSAPNVWYQMGCMLSAGGSYRWYRDALCEPEVAEAKAKGVDPYEILTAEAADAPLGCEGLLFLPYLTGERSPHGDPNARGVWFGISLRHGRAHLSRSILEGVSFGLRDSLEVMRELGTQIDQVRATGGGARSPLWRQIQADVLGVPLCTVNTSEGPAFGAALMAAVGAGAFDSLEQAAGATVKVVDRTEPIPANVKRYEEYYGLFRELYPGLKGSFAKDAALAEG